MFNRIKNIRIGKRLVEVNKYLDAHFREADAAPTVQYSLKKTADTDTKVKFSMRGDESDTYSGSAKFSRRDSYDSGTIKRTMRSMSVSSTGRILKEIEDSTNMSFVDKMLEHISKRHMRDSEVYKAAQIDRRLFSKIVSDREYKPAKDTCLAFAIALQLSLSDAQDILSRAGYTLSHSSKRDVIIEYFFSERMYDLNEINEVLYQLNQKVIGR